MVWAVAARPPRWTAYGITLTGSTALRGRGPQPTPSARMDGRTSADRPGFGSKLVRGVLDRIRADGGKAVPRCEFAAAYIARHPEYRDLLADEG